MKKTISIGLVLTSIFLLACNSAQNAKKTTIAQFKGSKLYLEDIQNNFKPFLSAEDSMLQIGAMTNSWLIQQVLIDNASQNLGDSSQKFDKLIEDYKKSLLIYHYENELSNQLLDSFVADSSMLSYYNLNNKNFELKRNIVKIWYAKFESSFSNLEELVPYFKSNSPEALEYVKEYCEQYAVNYFVSSSDWLYFDEIRKEIPLDPSYDQSAFIRNNKFKQFEDEESVYLLKILDYKVKNTISPFEIVKEEIRQMILNKRKVDLLKRNQKELLMKAIEKGDAKIL